MEERSSGLRGKLVIGRCIAYGSSGLVYESVDLSFDASITRHEPLSSALVLQAAYD
jgi:hypothetical protein